MRTIAAMMLAGLLGACMTASTTIRPTPFNGTQRWATEVYTSSQCILGNEPELRVDSPSAIVSALVPAVVDTAFSFFSAALEEAAKDRVTTYVGRRIVPLYRLTPERPATTTPPAPPVRVLQATTDVNCILVIAGNFGEANQSLYDFHPERPATAFNSATASYADVVTRLRAAHVPLAASLLPDMVYEARIVRVPGENAFVLQSTYLHVEKYQRSGGHPALSINIAFDNPATNSAGATLRAMPLQFGEVAAGTTLTEGRFGQGAVSDLMYAMPPSEGAKERQTAVNTLRTSYTQAVADIATQQAIVDNAETKPPARAAAEQRIAALRTAANACIQQEDTIARSSSYLMPMTLTATVLETQSAPAAIRFFNQVWTNARTALRTAAVSELDPAQRQTAETAERTARQQLEDQASNNRIAYLEARRTYDQTSATDVVAKEIAHERYIMALRTYNRTLVQLGLPPITE